MKNAEKSAWLALRTQGLRAVDRGACGSDAKKGVKAGAPQRHELCTRTPMCEHFAPDCKGKRP